MEQPVNSKSLFAFICEQMSKLSKQEVTIDEAKTQSLLAKQANNILKYELDRANLEMKLSVHEKQYSEKIKIRNAEIKNFD